MTNLTREKITAYVIAALSTEVNDLRGRGDIEINATSALDEIAIDYLGITHVICELEDIFLVSIPDDAIDLVSSKVSDVVELIASLLRKRQEAAAIAKKTEAHDV